MNKILYYIQKTFSFVKKYFILPIFKCVFFLIKLFTIISFIILSVLFSINQNVIGSLTSTFFSVLFLLLFFNSQFKIIEIFGMKISLKELTVSLKELKELSKVLSEISLYNIQSRMRMGTDLLKKQEFFEKIDNILDNVKIPKTEKDAIYNRTWHNYVIFDYYNDIVSLIERSFKEISFMDYVKNNKIPKFNDIEKYTKDLLLNELNWGIEKSSEEVDTSKINAHIENFDYYVKYKCFKDIELRNEISC
mgnify:CR=1 FL=1